MVEPSAWRPSDAVSFEVARDAVSTATSLLLRLADAGDLDHQDALTEARRLRLDLYGVNGFDRQQVDDFIGRVDARIVELEGRGR